MDLKHFLDYHLLEFGGFTLVAGNIISAAVILLIAKAVMMVIGYSLQKRVRKNHLDAGNAFAIRQIAKYLVWTFAIVMSLQALGVNISLILAGSAALLVGIGLGLQQTFKDFFSGILLLVEGSVKVGDVIELNQMVCTVHKIGMRTTTVITHDDAVIIVPNSLITSEIIINWTHSDKIARFQVKVGVAYDSNTDLVQQLLLESVGEHELKVGTPSVKLSDFADSAMIFELNFWSDDIIRIGQIKSDTRLRILSKFRENGIQIPFPQLEVAVQPQSQHAK